MARELTERQQKFLNVLMDEAGGNITEAKKLAGYSPNTPNREMCQRQLWLWSVL